MKSKSKRRAKDPVPETVTVAGVGEILKWKLDTKPLTQEEVDYGWHDFDIAGRLRWLRSVTGCTRELETGFRVLLTGIESVREWTDAQLLGNRPKELSGAGLMAWLISDRVVTYRGQVYFDFSPRGGGCRSGTFETKFRIRQPACMVGLAIPLPDQDARFARDAFPKGLGDVIGTAWNGWERGDWEQVEKDLIQAGKKDGWFRDISDCPDLRTVLKELGGLKHLKELTTKRGRGKRLSRELKNFLREKGPELVERIGKDNLKLVGIKLDPRTLNRLNISSGSLVGRGREMFLRSNICAKN
jgi:hypothetical protein